MKRIETILHRIVTPRNLAIFTTLIYVASLIPLFLIAQYNYASADDFSIGETCREAWLSSHSVIQVIWQAIVMAWHDYFNWMGYFVSIFFMSVHPAVFGEQFYAVTTWLMVGSVSLGTMYLLRAIFVKALKMDSYIVHAVSMVVLFVTIQCMVGRCEALYWYCGAVNYIFLHGISLFFFGGLLSAIYDTKKSKRVWNLIVAGVGGFLAGGGNQMTGLNVTILLLLAIFLFILNQGYFHKRNKGYLNRETDGEFLGLKFTKWRIPRTVWIPVAIFFLAFTTNVAAPGNFVRAEGATGMNPVKAVFVSFYYAFTYALSDWTNWVVLLMIILLIPLFWTALQGVSFRFPCPLLFVLFSFCIVAAMITPPLFAVGNIAAGRLQAITYVMYILWLTLDTAYVTGWMRQKLMEKSVLSEGRTEAKTAFSENTIYCILACFAVLAFGSVICVIPDAHYFTYTSAITDLMSGDAKAYGDALKERSAYLNSTKEQDVTVDPLPTQPALLFFSDITEDPEAWENRAISRYYDKNTVVILKK